MRSEDINPFAPPAAEIGFLEDFQVDEEADQVRRYHLSHEASIKTVGLLFYLMGGFSAFVALFTALALAGLASDRPAPDRMTPSVMIYVCLFYASTTVMGLALGYGLNRLRSWARWGSMVLSVLGLLLVVLIGVIGLGLGNPSNPSWSFAILLFAGVCLGYSFYLMVATKAHVIFSPAYRAVIEKTPQIRTRLSLLLKILLGILAVFFIFAVIGLVMVLFRL